MRRLKNHGQLDLFGGRAGAAGVASEMGPEAGNRVPAVGSIPASAAPAPSPRRRRVRSGGDGGAGLRRLEEELERLEQEDPAVAEAARKYDETVASIAAKPTGPVQVAARAAVDAFLKRDARGFPLSPETGGPLNAVEAERVATGKSLVLAGRAWEGGMVACWACVESGQVPEWPEAQGFRVTVYGDGTRARPLGKCAGCGAEVVGEHCLKTAGS